MFKTPRLNGARRPSSGAMCGLVLLSAASLFLPGCGRQTNHEPSATNAPTREEALKRYQHNACALAQNTYFRPQDRQRYQSECETGVGPDFDVVAASFAAEHSPRPAIFASNTTEIFEIILLFFVVPLIFDVALYKWMTGRIRHVTTPEYRARLWRKNKDKYFFDPDTGEWHFIKLHTTDKSGLIIDTMSRSQRMAREANTYRHFNHPLRPIMLLSYVGNFFANIALMGILTITQTRQEIGSVLTFAFLTLIPASIFYAAPVGMFVEFCSGHGFAGRAPVLVIDPPAREWAADDFGPPVTGNSPAAPEAPAVDLRYRPNQ